MLPTKRRLLGCISIIVLAVVFEEYRSPPAMFSFHLGAIEFQSLSIGSFLLASALFSIGAVVARGRFLTTALALAAGLWLVTQFLLLRVAAGIDNAGLFEIAFSNLPVLGAYLVAATFGSFAGDWYYRSEFGS
jgi:hypothetical protein